MAFRKTILAASAAAALLLASGATAHPNQPSHKQQHLQMQQKQQQLAALNATEPPPSLLEDPLYGAPPNDFSCVSDRNPVVMLHGLCANSQVDLNTLQWEMNSRGYCTFSQTYGAWPVPSWIGGLISMPESAADIAQFLFEVRDKTGADKIDIVGHSEGGVMSIYVPMSQAGVADIVGRSVALGPAIWGAEYFGFTDLWYIGGNVTRELAEIVLDTMGCPACEQMAPDGLIYDYFQTDAAKAPGDVQVTVIASENDALVPPEKSLIYEDGVTNVIVQDTCPDDNVGHAGLAWDKSVWRLILNALEGNDDEVFPCEKGLPF